MTAFQTGHTALQRAAAGGHLTIVTSLLSQGASLDHQDEMVSIVQHSRDHQRCRPAASYSHSHKYVNIPPAQCQPGFSNAPGPDKDTAAGSYCCVVMAGFSVVVLQHGNTALHEAAWKGYSSTVAALCAAKANVYMKNRGGFTALHLCCQSGHNQSCRVLLTHGCRPDVKNNVGSNAHWSR